MNRKTYITIPLLFLGMLSACQQAEPAMPPVSGEGLFLKLIIQSPDEWKALQGEPITLAYFLTNTGSLPLRGTAIVEDPPREVNCPTFKTVGNLNDQLDTNESVICTASYTPLEKDRAADAIISRARAMIGSAVSNEAIFQLGPRFGPRWK